MSFNNMDKVSAKELSPELLDLINKMATASEDGRLSKEDFIKLATMSSTGVAEASKEIINKDGGISYAIQNKDITIGSDTAKGVEFSAGYTGVEPIVFRQYEGTEEDPNQTITHQVVILDKNGNSLFSGSVSSTQFISNIAEGEPPMIVTSKTRVANLNADLLDGKHGLQYHRSSSTKRTILKTGFVASTELVGYAYKYVLSITGLSIIDTSLADIHFSKETVYEAGACAIIVETTGTDTITFRTTSVPTIDLVIDYIRVFDA